jgi:epoxyqueuosine reductase
VKDRVLSRAAALGFDQCRVTDARSPEHADAFRQWLAEGRHGGMSYLERTVERRLNPELVLPGAQSILLLAISYHRSETDPAVVSGESVGLRGVVARYARHRDYHDVLGPPLIALKEFVNELGGTGTRSLEYIDTGPVLERDLAHRAGIGFVGKHTNLISRDLGNWFFLGSILTTLRLEPDVAAVNRCGTCTRCMVACPTGAITEPFRLDARLCISYLTIEHRGSIPVELRPAIGDRIFGCDDCLAVCPWNRFAREGRLMREAYRPGLDRPSLLELLGMDDTTFRAAFRGTPFERTKRRGLLRNVAVALGNTGDGRALGALERAAGDPEPLIAEHAQWAIERILAREDRSGRSGTLRESACSEERGNAKLPPSDRGKNHP